MEKVLIPSGNMTEDSEMSGGIGGREILINDGFSLSAWSAVVEWFCLKRENIEILRSNRACVCAQVKFHYEFALII